MSFSVIPDNLLLKTLRQVPPKDRAVLSLVSRRWNRIISISWRSETAAVNQDSDFFFQYFLPECAETLEEVILDFQFQYNHVPLDEIFQKLAYAQPDRLKLLRLSHLTITPDISLKQYETSYRFPALEAVCFEGLAPLSTMAMSEDIMRRIVSNLPNLRLIKISGLSLSAECHFLYEVETPLEEIHLCNLEPLNKNNISLTFNAIYHFLGDDYKALRTLFLSHATFYESTFGWLCERALNLENLALHNCSAYGNAEVIRIGLLASLEQLLIVNCGNLVGDKTINLVSLNCKKLRVLTLHQSPITDRAICDISKITTLEHLDISRSSGIQDWSLTMALPQLPLLQSLWLCECESVVGSFFPLLLRLSPSLSHLGLSQLPLACDLILTMSAELLADRPRHQPLFIHALTASLNVAKLFGDVQTQNLPLQLIFCDNESTHSHTTHPSFPFNPHPCSYSTNNR